MTQQQVLIKTPKPKALIVLTQAQIAEIAAYINKYRALNQVGPLTWNSTIATFSQNWASYLSVNNLFQHSGNSLYGENIAWLQGYPVDMMASIKLSIDLWYNEISLYDFSKPGFSEATAHWSCLVWKASTDFGLGYAIDLATDTVVVTFNTSPPGNVQGQFQQNVFPVIGPAPTPVPTPVPVPVPTPIPTPVPVPTHTLDITYIINDLYAINNYIKNNTNKTIVINAIKSLILYIAQNDG